jgi:hypothetical protein
MNKVWMVLPLLLGAAACSKVATDDATAGNAVAGESSATASDRAGEQPPGIDPSVAPGVAFDFRYLFSLPERQIALVQEGHASLCGRLGATHCRVTGLNFEKARDGEVKASTSFLLDPALALSFAKAATALVERSDGKLATSQVTGENAGKAIVANDKSADGIKAELAKIDAQLRIPGLSKSARGALVTRSGELRDQLRGLATERDAKVESLATTPVAFDYEVGAGGFGFETPLRQGLNAGGASIAALLGFIALTLGMAGPWLLLGGAAWWGVRRLRRKPVALADAAPLTP